MALSKFIDTEPKPLKRCTKCKQLKPITEFHKHKRKKDGLCYQCKACVSERSKQRYRENKEEIRRKQRKYYQENHEIILQKQRSHRTLNRNAKAVRAYSKRNPEKIKAHWKLQQAIRRGQIFRSDECESCGNKTDYPLHGHHEDYSEPLEVMWLCQECHEKLHAQN